MLLDVIINPWSVKQHQMKLSCGDVQIKLLPILFFNKMIQKIFIKLTVN